MTDEIDLTYDMLKYPKPATGETWYVKVLSEITDTTLYGVKIVSMTEKVIKFSNGRVYKLSDVELVEKVVEV